MPAGPKIVTEALGRIHDRASFTCGVASLDRYLDAQAGQDSRRRVSQTFVAVHADATAPKPVLGYYTLSASAVALEGVPKALRRALPRYPQVPVALLGRLAVAIAARGQGIGAFLLTDAMRRVLRTAEQLGMAMLVVDALDDEAARFYERFGFTALVDESNRLFLPLSVIERVFASGKP